MAYIVVAATMLEVLPLTILLLLFSATQGSALSVALPIWWLGSVVLLAWSAAWGAGMLHNTRALRHRWGRVRELVAKALVIATWGLCLVLSLSIFRGSSVDQALRVFRSDLLIGGNHVRADLGVVVVMSYLWWRGLLLGASPLTRERLQSRFVAGFVVLVLAAVATGLLSEPTGTAMEQVLALLLPLQVFTGLAAVVLAHLADAAREHRERQRGRTSDEQQQTPSITWLPAAVGISGTVILPVLVLALVLSYNSVRQIGALIRWLVEGFLRALFFLLEPLIAWMGGRGQSSPHEGYKPVVGTFQASVPRLALDAGSWVLLAMVLLMIAWVLLRVLGRTTARHHAHGMDEEREQLNTRAVLANQLRAFFWRRQGRTPQAVGDTIPPESVRGLYRGMLHAAERVGRPRRANETPDEYAERILTEEMSKPFSVTVPARDARDACDAQAVESALFALTEAYDIGRYGSQPQEDTGQDTAPAGMISAQATIVRWLIGKSKHALDGHAPRDSRHQDALRHAGE